MNRTSPFTQQIFTECLVVPGTDYPGSHGAYCSVGEGRLVKDTILMNA